MAFLIIVCIVQFLFLCIFIYEKYERNRVEEYKRKKQFERRTLTASEVEIEKVKKINEFIIGAAKTTYKDFLELHYENSESKTIVYLSRGTNDDNKRLLNYFDDDPRNIETYLGFFRNLGWFVKGEFVQERTTKRFKVEFSSTPFEKE